MHLTEIILVTGAVVCFATAFLIASRPARHASSANSKKVKDWHQLIANEKGVAKPENALQAFHDETQ